MTIKKQYDLGDTVWIYGISPKNTKPTKGKIVKQLDLTDIGYIAGPHYIVEIPNHIEPLLEIRTWETISQDEKGPVGSFRAVVNLAATLKSASRLGFDFDEIPDDEPTEAQIHAALEKSRKTIMHQPLVIKDQPRNTNTKKYIRKKRS